MEIETAVRRTLLRDQTVRGYCVEKVFKYKLKPGFAGSGGRAIVVRRNGGWQRPEHGFSPEYPRVTVDCWADRTATGVDDDETTFDEEEKAWALYRAVDPLLHLAEGGWWARRADNPGLPVMSSERLSEPTLINRWNVPAWYVAQIGNCAIVQVDYGMQCVHGNVA